MSQSRTEFERVATADTQAPARRARRREQVERILELAAHLPPGDRFLIRQVFEFAAAVPDIARQQNRLRGVVYRQIRRLLRRMRAPLYSYIIARSDLLPPPLRETGRLVIVHGLTLASAAAASGATLHTIRRRLAAIKAIAAREAGENTARLMPT